MKDPKLDRLKSVPLFAQCSRKQLEFLASRTDEVDLPAGRALTRQGEITDSFYLILDGEVEVSVDGAERPVLKPGDYLGEIGMLDRGPATGTTTTRTNARLMVMSHAQFRDAITAEPDLLELVLAVVAQRLRRDEQQRAAQSPPGG
ncbi:MAG: cyclic nucleotide-binding domain-containing protein [Candidatus Dormibacteraeota bacterium]|nr:cyclic nucleotide-binding domain-containing protein [Candidatus Dormibacteraeota bacterium]